MQIVGVGAVLQWDWEMYGVSTAVRVKEVEDTSRIRFEWDDDKPTAVEVPFCPLARGRHLRPGH